MIVRAHERRIYPVPIKPDSGITNWGQWPADAEPVIWRWNKGKGLTFKGSGVFKCTDCNLFCVQHNRASLRGDLLCDDCLIGRARAADH